MAITNHILIEQHAQILALRRQLGRNAVPGPRIRQQLALGEEIIQLLLRSRLLERLVRHLSNQLHGLLRGGFGGREDGQGRVNGSRMQEQTDEIVGGQRAEIAALFGERHALGADAAAPGFLFLAQDVAVGAEPFALLDADDFLADGWAVAVLVPGTVAAVAEDDHVAEGTVTAAAILADGRFAWFATGGFFFLFCGGFFRRCVCCRLGGWRFHFRGWVKVDYGYWGEGGGLGDSSTGPGLREGCVILGGIGVILLGFFVVALIPLSLWASTSCGASSTTRSSTTVSSCPSSTSSCAFASLRGWGCYGH